MTTRRFLNGSDFEQVCSWFKERGLSSPSKDFLPLVGFIVEDVAVGFMYKTDSCLGILDWFVSNPSADAVERMRAFDHIVTLLLAHAKTCHIKAVKAETNNDTIKVLAMNQGFRFLGEHSSFFRET